MFCRIATLMNRVNCAIPDTRTPTQDSTSKRPFANTSTCRKAVITTRILQLVHELCSKRIHVTKRDLFYTDVKLFEVSHSDVSPCTLRCRRAR